jgi:FtsP/CotA-like multicopper oxidase with cupredoxin domain
MSRRYSLRALLAGAAHIAIVLSITGAKGAESSTLDTEVKPKTAPDRIFVLSDDGPTRSLIGGPFPRVLLNGESQPKPMQLRAGVKYRFRLINIRTDYEATVSIFYDEEPAEWRVVAKDGADLPASQATVRPATLTFAAGEIYDVEFTPTAPGIMTLQFGAPQQGPIPGQATDVQVVVR